ncbi:hypothetical protein [Streptomyces broussonetiae]|uniref:Uncharacterized protein n=1 Tax=Streptomyces broussonetiae TaxID=2686304 RepID=A0ABV5E5H9_9ACTN
MSQYTDGYTPRQCSAGLNLWNDMANPPIAFHCEITADASVHTAEAVAAVQAGIAAMKASLQTSFPGEPIDGGGIALTGIKGVPAPQTEG